MEGAARPGRILSLRSAVRMNLSKLDDAIRDSEAGVKLEPENPLARADLGFAQFAAKDYAGAAKSLDEARGWGRSCHSFCRGVTPRRRRPVRRSRPMRTRRSRRGRNSAAGLSR